jgi:CheY-like chemotaxis protein
MKGEPIVILLVEDDESHAEIVRRNLDSWRIPHQLSLVTDGQAALDYLHRFQGFSDTVKFPLPGLILLDLHLPKVDGLEVLKTIKEDPHLQHIPVVVLTTSNADTDKATAYANHAHSFLVKPFGFEQFVKLLENLGCWLVWNQYRH